MAFETLFATAKTYLQRFCVDIPNRRVGSAGNRAAVDFFERTAASFGFTTESTAFPCIDWQQEDVPELTVAGQTFQALASPYALGCDARGPLLSIATVAELEAARIAGAIVLLRGELAREQVMPKNFPFYNPDEHKHIISLLEAKQPAALVCATGRNPEMVGNLYPFPLFEDGDFDIPSVYLKDVEGDRLAAYQEQTAHLLSRAVRIPSTGCNVVARKGRNTARRITLFAHIDAKIGTPGANDNAAGVVVLLLLAELLKAYDGELGLELVALNGEDYFCAPGQQRYLTANAGKFEEIVLGVNLDGVGYYQGQDAYSFYECPPEMTQMLRAVFAEYSTLVEGEPWFQGDHGLFIMHQRPTLACTSDRIGELLQTITHTADDTPDKIDCGKLAALACALRDVSQRIGSL